MTADTHQGTPVDDGRAAKTGRQLLTELMTAIHQAGGQHKFARQRGISQSILSLTVTGRRGIDESVANALGYIKRVTVEYVPIRPALRPSTTIESPQTIEQNAAERRPGDAHTLGDGLRQAAAHHSSARNSSATDLPDTERSTITIPATT